MKRRTLFGTLCVLGLVIALAGGAAAAGGENSLISLRYLMEQFLPSTQSKVEEVYHSALEEAYDQALERLYQTESGVSGNVQYSADFRSRSFSQGDALTLSTGSGLMVHAGTAELVHSGVVIDVTAGAEVSSGIRLTQGHRYLVGEDTSATLTVQSGLIHLGLEGSYQVTDSGLESVPFVDVAQGDWYQSAVEYVSQTGLFSGMGDDRFSPDAPMNRAMLVTVFYRLAESPESELNQAQVSFADVNADSWYAPYVRWSYAQGIAAGTGDGLFSPEENVARQQILVMLHSFARQYLGLTLTGAADLSVYADGEETAAWAREAVAWAAANALIVPSEDGTIRPTDPASRAEVAAILMKFTSMYQEPAGLHGIE